MDLIIFVPNSELTLENISIFSTYIIDPIVPRKTQNFEASASALKRS